MFYTLSNFSFRVKGILKNTLYYFPVLVLSIFNSCEPQKKSYGQEFGNPTLLKIDTNRIFDFIDNDFGTLSYYNKDTLFIVTENKAKDTLRFYNTFDSSLSFNLPIGNFKLYFEQAAMYIHGDNLFALNNDVNKLYLFTINRMELNYLKTISLNPFLKKTNSYLRSQKDPFVINDSLFISAIGTLTFKKSFLHPQSHIFISLTNNFEPKSSELNLHYPKKYLNGKDINIDTYVRFFNDSTVLLGYKTYDSLYLFNTKSRKIVQKTLYNSSSDFIEYDLSNIKDLAYRRWYEETNEKNRNIVILRDKILIIKHQRKADINSASQFQYFLLDKNLNIIKNNLFTHSLSPSFCFQYKKGFIILDKELKNTYYYETD